MAGSADREAELLHELHHAHQRVADLTSEIDTLRWRLARAERAAGVAAAAGRGVVGDSHSRGECGAAAAGGTRPAPGSLSPLPPSPPHGLAAPTYHDGRRVAPGCGMARGDRDAADHVRAAAAAVDVAANVVASWLEEPLTPAHSSRLPLHGKGHLHVAMTEDASSRAQDPHAAHGHSLRPVQRCRTGPGGSDRGVRTICAAIPSGEHLAGASRSSAKVGGGGGTNGRAIHLCMPACGNVPAGETTEVPNAASATTGLSFDRLCGDGRSAGCTEACGRETGAGAAEGGASDEEMMRLRLANRRLLAALSVERARLSDAESHLLARQAEHRDDLFALGRAREDAAVAAQALRDQAEWVRSLDEMRITDMQAIQRLEARLEWAAGLLQAPGMLGK